ncbi:MAG: magnesium transporter [Bacteroidota bacterium]
MPFFLSSLQNAVVRDKHNKRVGRLKDLIVPRMAALPDVIALVVQQGRERIALPWSTVSVLAHSEIRLNGPSESLPTVPFPEGVFLVRDLLDAQVVDINGAKVVRVNDIVLSQLKDRLFISGLDIGTWGLMRRLGWASVFAWVVHHFHLRVSEGIIPWDSIEPIEKESSRVRLSVSQDRLIRMHPADLADVVEEMGYHQRTRLLDRMSNAQLAALIEESEPSLQSSILRELDPERAADVLGEMEPDEAADLLGDLPEEEAQALIRRMDPEEAAEVRQLLTYEEGTAGAVMNTSFVAVDGRITVGDALRWYRKELAEAEMISYIYLLDPNQRLSGAVSIRRLLLSDPYVRLASLSTRQLVTVHVHTPSEEAVDEIAHYSLAALPVVDAAHRLVGVISILDALEIERGEERG